MKRILVVALASVLCLALAGAAMASEAEGYTVGDFAVNLAKMVTNKADYTPEQAAAYLAEVGVELGELNAQVDEEIFVGAFNRLGVALVTATPEAAITSDRADQVFQMFDTNDTLFTGELFKLCKQGAANQNSACVTDADCDGGSCQVVQSIKCDGGGNDGAGCMSGADCPGGFCNIPPGQAKKLGLASPSD
jgi:hypothetical protein